MNFEDFFDKADPDASRNRYRPRSFDSPTFTPPAVMEPSLPNPLLTFLSGVASVCLLSLTEGTLAWVAFESLEDLGVIDERLPWHPFVVIALCVNLARVFDKAAFRK